MFTVKCKSMWRFPTFCGWCTHQANKIWASLKQTSLYYVILMYLRTFLITPFTVCIYWKNNVNTEVQVECTFNSLLYANEVVIIGESEYDSQKAVYKLHNIFRDCQMSISASK